MKSGGFQLVPRASDARSLLDCAAITTPVPPSAKISGGKVDGTNEKVLMPWVSQRGCSIVYHFTF
jgi:hypothetical protein